MATLTTVALTSIFHDLVSSSGKPTLPQQRDSGSPVPSAPGFDERQHRINRTPDRRAGAFANAPARSLSRSTITDRMPAPGRYAQAT
jgi:hypothetical protein